MKNLYLLILILITSYSYSQNGTLRIHGRVENENKLVKQVSVEVVKDNELIDEFTNSSNGSYRLSLKLGSVYNVTFFKEGYISKTVGVIAKTPDSLITGQFFFQLDVDLFPLNMPDTNETVFPDVAKLFLKDEKEGFVYDKQYVRWITNEFDAKKESQKIK
jgi:hypothetical protein